MAYSHVVIVASLGRRDEGAVPGLLTASEISCVVRGPGADRRTSTTSSM